MVLSLIADAAPADPQISGAWLLAAIAKVGSVLVALAGAIFGTHKLTKRQMERQHSSITIKPPIPTLSVENSNPPHPSWDQHIALAARVTTVELHQEQQRTEQAQRHLIVLQTGHERELRLMEKIDDIAKGIYQRLHEVAAELRNHKKQ